MQVCFVTNELFPFHPGGIGRLIHSFICEFGGNGRNSIHILMPDDCGLSLGSFGDGEDSKFQEFASLRNVAEFHFYDAKAAHHLSQFGLEASDLFYDGQDNYLRSFACMVGLLKLQEKGIFFDLVEFVDFGGLATATIEARRVGLLADMRIAVRLHSTFSIIALHEGGGHLMTEWVGRMYALEKFALKNADIVVGHLPFVSETNRRLYGLSDKWADKVVIETPPVFPQSISMVEDAGASDESIFLFSSRFQRFKRPDIFIKAAIIALDMGIENSRFVLASYGWDADYIAQLNDLIPANYKGEIVLERGLSPEDRLALIAKSTVVLPSTYESLCLFAYEAALAGRPVILNARCEAFGENTPWVDQVNCLKFDGTAADLAQMMIDSRNWHPLEVVSVAADTPYWDEAHFRSNSDEAGTPAQDLKKIGLICFLNQLQDLDIINTLRTASTEDNIQLFVCCNSGDAVKFRQIIPDDIELLVTSFEELCPEHILHVANNYELAGVAVVDRDIEIDFELYTRAHRCLNEHNHKEQLCVVTSHIVADGIPSFVSGDDETLAIISCHAPHKYSVVGTQYLAAYKQNDFWGEDWLSNFIRIHVASKRAQVFVLPHFVKTKGRLVSDDQSYVSGSVGLNKAYMECLGFVPLTNAAPVRIPKRSNDGSAVSTEILESNHAIGLQRVPWSKMSTAVMGTPPPPDLGFECFSFDHENQRILTHPTDFGLVFGRIINGVPAGVSAITAYVMTCHPDASELDYALSVSDGVDVVSDDLSTRALKKMWRTIRGAYRNRVDDKMWVERGGSGWHAIAPMRKSSITLNLPQTLNNPLTLNFGVRAHKGQHTHLAWAYWYHFCFA
ncbi:DUF6212 domain-containing protein [Nitratireductor sp. XY-223]|uniref:DUF6212 domain-containing protein n=1 Tax=Nitratireductor sp. XY-223 TaxID=2561926 RepID=UPI0010A9F964|nr:DUF6212 domain-containing protein [Nitratireductor sp. XY-223]